MLTAQKATMSTPSSVHFFSHVSVDPSTKSIDTMPDDQVGKLHTRYEKGKDDANIGEGSTAAVRRAGECVRANR